VTEHTFHAYPDDRFDPDHYDITPAPPTMVLDGGEILDLGNRRFEVLHYPGHSPGSIALWESESGVLFSGDVVYDGELSDKLYHSDRGEYERSLERLREIPVQIVHGGHHASFGHQRFLEIIDSYLRRSSKHHVLSK
jgi:glyoxylase-like metal-dependent hydrolase (beta-lactamase superfamily II)